jgi:hypothetical protein
MQEGRAPGALGEFASDVYIFAFPQMSKYAAIALCAALFVALITSNEARASDVQVQWEVPAGCPDRESLRAGLARRLGRAVTFGPGAPLRLWGTIAARGDGYTLDLRTEAEAGSEARHLQARSCNELTRASVLIAALLLTDTPKPAKPSAAQAGEAAALSPSKLTLSARASLVGDLGSLPSLALGPSLAFGIVLNRTQLELAGLYFPTQDIDAPNVPRPVANVQLMAAGAGVCQLLLRTPELSPCLHVELGRLSAHGQNLAPNRSSGVAWLFGSVGLRLGVALGDTLVWQTELSAGLPWNRVNFAVNGLSNNLGQVSTVAGRLETGLGARF